MERIMIPNEEFKLRIKKLQEKMKKDSIELFLAYGNEAEPQYVRYLSDYWPSFETAGVLVAQTGEPKLLIGPESFTYASDRTRIPEVRLLKAFRESSEPEYPGKPLDTFRGLFEEMLGKDIPEKIYVAGYPLMTIGVYSALKEVFKEENIVRGDYLLNDLRMIKTENELRCMRKAAEITRKTFDYVLENIHPGMTETQVVGVALGKMHELGAERESYPLWVLTGDGSDQAISRARQKKIKPGDFTFLQIGARYEGYASSIGRPVIFGKASEDEKKLIAAGYIGQNTVFNNIRDGLCAGELARLYEKNITEAGYGDWLLYGPCHGNGLMEGEAPWVESNSEWILKENMTFCCDIFLGNGKYKKGLRMEDVIRVTKDGCENLTNYPQKVFEI